MNKLDNIVDVAQILGDGGPFNSDVQFNTVDEVIDSLVACGNTEKVYAFHDEHLGLKDNLSEAFLNSPIDDTDDPKFESELEEVLEQANTIISLSKKELSSDDLDEIEEDKISRGFN